MLNSKTKSETLKSLTKALDILQLFLEQRKELGILDICNLTGLNKTTVNRLVSTLKKRGYISQKEKRGKYFLGSIYISFYELVSKKLLIRNVARPYLVKLGKKVNENVVLTYGDGLEFFNEVMYEAPHSKGLLKNIPSGGKGFPQGTASGKVLLAERADDELQSYYTSHQVELKNVSHINNYQEFKEQIQAIRTDKLAYDIEEQQPGIRGVSTGLRNPEGYSIGVISIAGASARFTRERMAELGLLLKNTALEISHELGYQGS
jgi:IclR family transcriptional regulator, KDG regulon repressor